MVMRVHRGVEVWQCSQVVTASRLGMFQSVMGFPREFESRHCQYLIFFRAVSGAYELT